MSRSDDYQPSEASIANLLARFTPRQLAIGYLRAQRRFRQADLEIRTEADIDAALAAARAGEGFEHISDPLQRAIRRFNREF